MSRGKIDIVVGGQWGDEGKGASCVMLATELKCYAASLRVGGSQAEHRFKIADQPFKFRCLPSVGALPKIELYLGAGHIISPSELKREMDDYNIDRARIAIDPVAAVVTPEIKQRSRANDSYGRGGYSMGMSDALAAKMKRDGRAVLGLTLASELKLTSAQANLRVNRHLDREEDVLIEGSQGALLCLNHGVKYPHVTSYDVTAPAILGQAGLHWEDVRDVYAIYKIFPTRVAGKSGYIGEKEISWAEIESQKGSSVPEERKFQTWEDGSLRDYERVAEIDWDLFTYSLLLNRPTKIILTHVDWCAPSKARIVQSKMEDLAYQTLERHVPVAYIRHGESIDDYVKGANW